MKFHIHDPINDDEWVDHANCLGIDANLFFPERGQPTAEAKAICAGCTVRDECLDYAIDNDVRYGIWGGKSIRQRRRIARDRRSPGEAA